MKASLHGLTDMLPLLESSHKEFLIVVAYVNPWTPKAMYYSIERKNTEHYNFQKHAKMRAERRITQGKYFRQQNQVEYAPYIFIVWTSF